jgi:hypothetical protein
VSFNPQRAIGPHRNVNCLFRHLENPPLELPAYQPQVLRMLNFPKSCYRGFRWHVSQVK